MEVGVTKEPEVSEEGKQGEEESNMDTENNDSTAQEKKEEKIEGEKIEDEKIEDETEKNDEEAKERVFQLVVVNSYGSQEVNKLKEDDKLLKLTSESLAHCIMNTTMLRVSKIYRFLVVYIMGIDIFAPVDQIPICNI